MDSEDPERMTEWLRLRVSETIERYRQSGNLTAKRLFRIERLWIDGWTLRQLARYERVAPAAVSCSIEALKDRAPEFYRWWFLKHRTRRNRNRHAR